MAAHVDFETRSVADLKVVGLHNYARHPSTGVWCMAWAIGSMEPEIWVPGMPLPQALMDHVRAGGRVVAHNAPFELEIWNVICVQRHGFYPLFPEQTECTMATAYAMGLPGALEDGAQALGLHMLKDAEGRALMLRMARPRRVEPNGDVVWWDEPEKVARLHEYCKQDVRVERALHERMVPLGEQERRVWLADYRINQRGVAIDVPTVTAAVHAVDHLKGFYDHQLTTLTGGAVTAVGALAALKQWCAAQGYPVESLAKTDLPGIIERAPEGPVKEALKVREDSGKASLAKLDVMLAVAGADGRLRNLYQYHGANTGRWAGRKVQPHNLTRDVPPQEQVEQAFRWMREGNLPAIEMTYGPVMSFVSRALRPLFVPKPGHVLVGGDWSAVEGRGVAWFAGEEWKLEAFRKADAGLGPGLYEVTAGMLLDKDPTAIATAYKAGERWAKQDRQMFGKVPELAFGYQGGEGAARAFGFKGTSAEANHLKKLWRHKHPATVAVWRALNEAAINAVLAPGTVHYAGAPGRQVRFKVAGSFLWCLLPNGKRALCYPYPKILDGQYGHQLTYMTQPGPADLRKSKIIHDESNSAVWARVSTYGGSLLENIVQAFCRDFLAELILWADDNSFPVVIHTHDDCYMEIPREYADEAHALIAAKMNTAPVWAAEFPLYAEVDVLTRYGT